MKATTLFALTIALVLGLGAAATAKYMGLFEKKAEAAAPPPPVPPTMILVAGTNLFKGHTLTAADVRVREASPDEVADYKINRKDYLPPVVNAANYRIMTESVVADQPLKIKNFEVQEFENLEKRISPYMRAVQLELPKARCAGGMIQKDDHVDVMLTSNVAAGDATPLLRTTCIARDCRVVAKRNTLLTAILPNPDDMPFTLEVNPYRAALIAFAEQKGHVTLMPRSKGKAESAVPALGRPTFSDMDSAEYRDEDDRVTKVESAEYAVSEIDLVRVFKLPPIPTKVPPPPPTRIAVVKGTGAASETVFGPDGRPVPEKKDQFGKPTTPSMSEPNSKEFEPKFYSFAKPTDGNGTPGGINGPLKKNEPRMIDGKPSVNGQSLPPGGMNPAGGPPMKPKQ